VAVIGPNADQVQFGDYSWTRNNRDGITPLEGIRRLVGDKVDVRYARGCSLTSRDTTDIAEAVALARTSDVVLIFGGSASASLARDYKSSTCGEGFDLHDLSLTGAQRELIEAVRLTGTPTVLILVSGKPFAIEHESEVLPAILMQWYGGERAGEAVAELLFGEASPSGRLTFSIPRSVGHLPVYYNHLSSDRGLYHNHGSLDNPGRDYVFSAPTPLYAFGHGLTYTTFDYRNPQAPTTRFAPSGDTVRVTVNLVNTGARSGKEVLQLYTVDKASTHATPVRQLRDFRKVELKAGEECLVELSFPIEALRTTDAEGVWQPVSEGEYLLEMGSASDKILASISIFVGDAPDEHIAPAASPLARKSTKRIRVTGEVRDVQATLLPGVIVRNALGQQLAVTDADGRYAVSVGNHDVLTFEKAGYETKTLEPDDRRVLNVML
jgi:beta-glucosidase